MAVYDPRKTGAFAKGRPWPLEMTEVTGALQNANVAVTDRQGQGIFPEDQILNVLDTTGTVTGPFGVTATAVGTGGTFTAGTYFYKITTLTAAGESAGSTEASAVVGANGKIVLTWTGVTGATGYKIYRATTTGAENGGTSLVTTIGSGATVTYTDTGSATTAGACPAVSTDTIPAPVQSATSVTGTTGTWGGTGTYYYEVTALTAAGETTASNEQSAVIAAVNQTAVIAWAAVTGATGYNVYRSTTAGTENVSPTLVASNVAGVTYTDTGTATSAGATPASNTATLPAPTGFGAVAQSAGGTLAAGTYYYKVVAYNASGSSIPSAEVSAVVGTNGQITLTWSAAIGTPVTGYKIYRAGSAGGESGATSFLAQTASLTYTDTGGTALTSGSVPTVNTAYIPWPDYRTRFAVTSAGNIQNTVDSAGNNRNLLVIWLKVHKGYLG